MEALAPDMEVLHSSLRLSLSRALQRACTRTRSLTHFGSLSRFGSPSIPPPSIPTPPALTFPLLRSRKVATAHFEHVTTFKRNPHTLLESESSRLLPAYSNPPAARLQVSLACPPSLTSSLPPSLSLNLVGA